MMKYFTVVLRDGTEALQHIANGQHERLCDKQGFTLPAQEFTVTGTDPVAVAWEPVQSIAKSRVISKPQLMERFTDEELVEIYSAAKTEPQVEIWVDRFKSYPEFDLDSFRFMADMKMLQEKGLLAPERAQIIAG